jgi:hypothetical protein
MTRLIVIADRLWFVNEMQPTLPYLMSIKRFISIELIFSK